MFFFLERIEFEWWSTKSGHLYWFNSDVMFLSELLSAAWSQTAECESSEVCSVGQQSNLQLTLFCQHHGSRTLFKIYYVGILHSVWERLVVFSHHHKCFLEERWDSSGLQESQRGSLRTRQTWCEENIKTPRLISHYSRLLFGFTKCTCLVHT